MRNQFEYGIDFYKARQEVINRLQTVQGLPPGVNPVISPMTPTGEILRYTLKNPVDKLGRPIYALHDLKALQDWFLEREFKRIPRIADVVSFGGTSKRYEIQPDPDRLKAYGIGLGQLQSAIGNSNANVGGDHLFQGSAVFNVRGLGLIGGGQDPMQARDVLATNDPAHASKYLRLEEERRLREIREIVLGSTNNVPVCVDHVVEGGPSRFSEDMGKEGALVGHQTRLGKVGRSVPKKNAAGKVVRDKEGRIVWEDEDDKVMGIVLLRKNEESIPALRDVESKVRELNDTPGRLLPGVKLETHFDKTDLINVTTETVRENLLMGMSLVTVILLMFLSNVRSALIVAINIPLALLFAFAVLFLRGKSANLLSIGAVDFGIIVDSSVIMVENIYRHLNSGDYAELPLKDRIVHASSEVHRSLFFSTVIMVCALLPLFTMQGPEGQIFGPMADTYAFALGGALLLALTLSPVLCLLLFRRLKPVRENFLVRAVKAIYLWQLKVCLNHRLATVGCLLVATAITLTAMFLFLGREFMPELEEGNLYVRGTFPVQISLPEVAEKARWAREVIREFPEVEMVASQVGRPDDGTDATGFYNAEFTIPLRPESEWPKFQRQGGLRAWFGSTRARTKRELVDAMDEALKARIPGVDWNFSQYIRDNVMEALSGVKGDNSVKIIGPDLDELERLAGQVKRALQKINGIEEVGVFRIKGQPNLEFPIDRNKCNQWGISVNDVENVIQTAVGGKAFSQMIEGEKSFDLTLRWPQRLRSDEETILKIPVDVQNNQVTGGLVPSLSQTPLTGPVSGISSSGSSAVMPSATGSVFGANLNYPAATPRRLLRDLVTPLDDQRRPNPKGKFVSPGASTISREQGKRIIAVKFSVRNRDLAGAVAEAQEMVNPLIQMPYQREWSGEYQEMGEAESRMLKVVSLSMVMIVLLLYLAFRSLLDAAVVLSNVVAISLGGIWALLLTGTNFNVSAAVGFISILGVAVMNGLLLVSSFNQFRARGVPLVDALIQGVERRVRPLTMTTLTAIFGLLPAALSTRIGSQSQRPLAIVVVGGMIMTLFLSNLVPVFYSFYGKREPRTDLTEMAH
jgi:cobalt-zinc-cadmium resistance protein CzcA